MTIQNTKFVISEELTYDNIRLRDLLDSFLGDREGIFEVRDNGDIQDTETGDILGNVCTTTLKIDKWEIDREYLSIKSYIEDTIVRKVSPELKEVNAPIREAYLDKKVQDILDEVLKDDPYASIRPREDDND